MLQRAFRSTSDTSPLTLSMDSRGVSEGIHQGPALPPRPTQFQQTRRVPTPTPHQNQESLEESDGINIYFPASIERRIQRNILPDLVCDSLTNARFRRHIFNSSSIPDSSSAFHYEDSTNYKQDNNIIHYDGNRERPLIMGQRTSTQPKQNISFAWVLRGDQSSDSSTSSSLYKKPISPRSFDWRTNDSYYTEINKKHSSNQHNRKLQLGNTNNYKKQTFSSSYSKANKHHLFSEKNLKDNGDLDDYCRFRRSLIDGDCLSLSTTETSINKCVDKATSVKKKRYRSKSRTGGQRLDVNGGNNRSEMPVRPKSECRTVAMEIQMPQFNEDTCQFDEYLKKCSLLCPANIPMLLLSDTIMYMTRHRFQSETFLSLGTIVNAIFSIDDWIYIQLPGKIDRSGYVIASSCIPMEIELPRKQKLNSLNTKNMLCSNRKVATLSKSTNNLSEKLTNNFRANTLTPKMHGPEFETLYGQLREKLRQNSAHNCERIKTSGNTNRNSSRNYSLSAQNLQKFNVLSSQALKQETEALAARLDSASLC